MNEKARETIGTFVMRYLLGNRRVKVQKGKKHIACLGDSITFGAGVGGDPSRTWEVLWNRKIGEDWQVLNYGVNGRTMQSAGDYPYTRDRIYEDSLSCKADLYLIMFGTNDAKPQNWIEDRFRTDYENFVKRYLDFPDHPRVVLMIPPHCFPEGDGPIASFGIDIRNFEGIASTVNMIAKEYSLQVIDLYTLTEGHPEWFADGVHPNQEGNTRIAEHLFQQIKL